MSDKPAPVSFVTKIAAFASVMSAISAIFSGYIAFTQVGIASDAARKVQQTKIASELIEAGLKTCNTMIPKIVKDNITYGQKILPDSFEIERIYKSPKNGLDARAVIESIRVSINDVYDLRDDLLVKAAILYNWSRYPEAKSYQLLREYVLSATNPKEVYDSISKYNEWDSALALALIDSVIKLSDRCERTFASMSYFYKYDFDVASYIASRK